MPRQQIPMQKRTLYSHRLALWFVHFFFNDNFIIFFKSQIKRMKIEKYLALKIGKQVEIY